jgi:hypothetical protein
MHIIKDAVALALLSFIFCKLIFAMLSWFVDEKKAPFHWKQTQQSFQHVLHLFVQRVKENFLSRPSALLALICASLLYHLFSFFPAIELLAFLESVLFEIPYDAGDGLWQFLYLDPHDRLWPWWLYVIVSVCGVGCDVLSARVTWTVLKKADFAKSLARMFSFLFVDGLLLLILLAGAVFFLFTVVSAILPREIDYTDIVLILTQVISVSVPTLSYCSIGFAILIIRWLPYRLRTWFFTPSRKQASANQPILPRLGTAAGTLSAILVAGLRIIL